MRTRMAAVVAACGLIALIGLAGWGGSASDDAAAEAGPTGERSVDWVLVGTRRGSSIVVRPRTNLRRCERLRAAVTETTDDIAVSLLADPARCTQRTTAPRALRARVRRLDGIPDFVNVDLSAPIAGRRVTGPLMAPLTSWQGGTSIGASGDYPRAVPDVAGLSLGQARELAAAYGARITTIAPTPGTAWVTSQWPRFGATDDRAADQIYVRTAPRGDDGPPPAYGLEFRRGPAYVR